VSTTCPLMAVLNMHTQSHAITRAYTQVLSGKLAEAMWCRRVYILACVVCPAGIWLWLWLLGEGAGGRLRCFWLLCVSAARRLCVGVRAALLPEGRL
jgi:hypothetical protein